ncbi:MAG: 2-phosphosulfolactate phosphatase [Chitinophagales bacterium]|nr:2-phosphosulfolactate phosphatase [Chitinophagales bacterium]MDW8428829.1 2-phosphosulfolactate phosphatase [Chitinophagales bacterium]
MPDKAILEVCLSPALLPLYPVDDKVVVVVDVLRATTTMCVALDQGAEKVIPVETIEECMRYRGKENHILAGERNGRRVEGFDFGNSPFEFMNGVVKGKILVLTTTNGTRAIKLAQDAHQVVAGAFINFSALTRWLISEGRDTLLLCSGWRNKFNLEDTIFAGAVIHHTKEYFLVDSDAAFAAEKLYLNSRRNMMHFVKQSSHYRRLAHLGVVNDVKYCLRPDLTDVVPILKDGALMKADIRRDLEGEFFVLGPLRP